MVFIIPNTHGSVTGWIDDFSINRNYMANDYLNQLDRVRDDPDYKFVLSEVPNLIGIQNFQPERMPELRERIREGRVGLVNGFFLESAINLSGGEALARLGVEGLRWYRRAMETRPRYAWMIDTCGVHEQMPQIVAGLGMEAMVYCRGNRVGKRTFWSVSPDGTKVLTLAPGSYMEAASIFAARTPLSRDDLKALEQTFAEMQTKTPAGAPIFAVGASNDYSLAPLVKAYPKEFLRQWAVAEPGREVVFATLDDYMDELLPGIRSGKFAIPSFAGGAKYEFPSFWIENPRTKTWFRQNEEALQAAEALAAIASLEAGYRYPVDDLSGAWLLTCMNMDRNVRWGSAAGVSFVSPTSWDAQDRYRWVDAATARTLESSASALAPKGKDVTIFNPLNWRRNDVVRLHLPAGSSLAGVPSEALPDGSFLARIDSPAMSVSGSKVLSKPPESPKKIDLPETITTRFYSVRVDPKTGALTSIKLRRPGSEGLGREVLGGPANVVVAEHPLIHLTDLGDFLPPRQDRRRVGSSSDKPSRLRVTRGPLAVTVEAAGDFYGGGAIKRTVRFYHDHPRIDFETELNDIPNATVVVAEFPLAPEIPDIRSGIPFGFSHGAWEKPNPGLEGWTRGIVPAIRWQAYSFADGGGFAILDRGLSGREIHDRTPGIFLINAIDSYLGFPCPWLSGKGRHRSEYAIVAYDEPWEQARIPRLAREYNQPLRVAAERRMMPAKSYLETSDNVIVEAMRREASHIELRLAESLGRSGTAMVQLRLPHGKATMTNLCGEQPEPLPGGPVYRFAVRPQQIVTLHFATETALPEPAPIENWDRFVPPGKLAALHHYNSRLIGHPPFGNGQTNERAYIPWFFGPHEDKELRWIFGPTPKN